MLGTTLLEVALLVSFLGFEVPTCLCEIRTSILIEIKGKSLPLAIGSCAFLGTPVAVLKAQGGGLRGEGWEYLPREQQERRKSTFFRKPAGTQVDSTTSGPPASPSPSTNLS